ncbi:MAG: tetratricopeptide repeat protein, partial [Chloroflexota bacterium]
MQKFFKRLLGEAGAPARSVLNPAQQEINALLETGATAYEQGFNDTALEIYQRGLTLARTTGEKASVEYFLSGIASVYVDRCDFDTARPALDEALQIAREQDDPRALARCLNNLGSFYAAQEQWGVAQTYHQQALDEARRSNHAEGIALTLENLAQDYLQQDNPSYAQHLLKEAVVIAQAGGLRRIAPRVVGLLAEATLAVGERANAQKLLQQAVYLAHQAGQEEQELRWLQVLARVELGNGEFTQAISHLQAAENLALRLGNQPVEFFMNSALDLTAAYQRSGNSAQAEEYATRALAQARSTGNAAHEAMALTRLGMAAHGMGDFARAQSFLDEALAFYEDGRLDDRGEHLQILLTLGTSAMRLGDQERAMGYVQRALVLTGEGVEPNRQAEAYHLLGSLANQRGDRNAALEHWGEALRLLENGQGTAHHAQIARLRCDVAQARRESGDLKGALDEYEKALVLLNHITHPPTRGLVLANAATLYTELGDVDTAQAFYDEAISIAQASGDRRAESLRLGNLGWFYSLTGRPQMAIDRLERALALSRELDDMLMIAVQTNNLARTYYFLEDYSTARTLFKQATAAATSLGNVRWLALFQADM